MSPKFMYVPGEKKLGLIHINKLNNSGMIIGKVLVEKRFFIKVMFLSVLRSKRGKQIII